MPNFLLRALGIACFISIFFPGVSSAQHTGHKSVTLQLDSVPLKTALAQMERQAGVKFVYSSKAIQAQRRVSLSLNHRPVMEALDALLGPLDVGYSVIAGQIALRYEDPSANATPLNVATAVLEGVVMDEKGESLAGVRVSVKRSSRGVFTDLDGKYEIAVAPHEVAVFSYVGYQTREIRAGKRAKLNVTLTETPSFLTELSVVGARSTIQRINTERSVPLDVVTANDIQASGQTDLAQALQYASPSFNSSKYGINNMASFVDPATLRGLGPDQLLVLVNGKRRHPSSLLNLNNTVGRGTVSTDLNVIPSAAIERIEILRDGASAQYGSDAIAGIINIVLKKRASELSAKVQTGITAAGDGLTEQAALFAGVPVGRNGGFFDLTLNYQRQDSTNRAGAYTGIVYDDHKNPVRDDSMVAVRRFNRNAAVYGTAQSKTSSAFFNAEIPVYDHWSFYTFGGASVKDILAYGFYRYPSDPRNSNLKLYPDGYLPEFPARLTDYSLVGGFRRRVDKEWNADLSISTGANSFNGSAIHTVNASQPDSLQTSFDVGGTTFRQTVSNLNFSRNFSGLFNTQTFSFSLGSEVRVENYTIREGEPNSYSNGQAMNSPQVKLGGANGRPGFTPSNALDRYRTNAGVYMDLESDVTAKILAAAALRMERYSDFGDNLSAKLSGRYKISDRYAVRASFNSGFRAPSLQQLYYSQVQYQFFSVNGVTQLRQVLILRNDDPTLRLLGVDPLKPENSLHFNAGFTARIDGKSAFTIDGYLINIRNRIALSARLDTSFPVIKQLLLDAHITDLQFFSNAVDTRTTGCDVVFTRKEKWGLEGENFMSVSAALNMNQTNIIGKVRTPAAIEEVGAAQLLDRVSRGLIEVAQPASKLIFTFQYHHQNWDFLARNTRFGSVIYQDNDPRFDQTFSAKMVTDAVLTYGFGPHISASVGGNNIFNIYPDKILFSSQTSDGQIPYSRNTTQFGFNGAFYYAGLQAHF